MTGSGLMPGARHGQIWSSTGTSRNAYRGRMSAWVPPGPPRIWSRTAATPFVGRDDDVHAVLAAWDHARGGVGQCVLVTGEAGAGKSRLLSEACLRFVDDSTAVLVGRCVSDLGAPFDPFTGPMSVLLPMLRSGTLSSAGPAIDRLDRMVGDPDGEEDEAPGEPPSLRTVLDAVVGALTAVCERGPAVLVLEDLHWAGPSARRLLVHLVDRLADLPLLVLGSARMPAPDGVDLLALTGDALHRNDCFTHLSLAPLGLDAVRDYLRGARGNEQQQVPAADELAAARVLHRYTGGNAFFLRALWAERGKGLRLTELAAELMSEGGRPPRSVADVLNSRLSRLVPRTRAVLDVAAVVGEEFEAALLLGACAVDGPGVLASLDDAVGAGLVESVPGRAGRFRFVHAVARQCLLDALPSAGRADAHRRVAECLLRTPGATDRVPRLAHHFAAAVPLVPAGLAVQHLVQAARGAAESLAHAEAATLFERAARLCEEPGEHDSLELDAARAHTRAGEFAAARALAGRTARTARDARSRVAAAITFEVASWRPGHPGHRAEELLVEALEGLPPDPRDPVYVQALAGLGRARTFTGRFLEGRKDCEQAVALARELDDAATLDHVLCASLCTPLLPDALERQRSRAREVLALGRAPGEFAEGSAAFYLGVCGYVLGRRDDVAMAASRLEDLGRRSDVPRWWGFWSACQAYGTAFWSGDLASAERACARQHHVGGAFAGEEVDGAFGLQSFMVRRELGLLGQVSHLLTGQEALDRSWAPGLLALYVELGMMQPARRVAEALARADLEQQRGSAVWPVVIAFLAEAAVALEDAGLAARVLPALDEYAGLNLVAGAFSAVLGPADLYRAALLGLLDAAGVEEALVAAAGLADRTGALLHRAYADVARAGWLAERGAAGQEIGALLRPVEELAERQGLVRLGSLARRAAVRAEAPTNGRPAGLTAREIEVLRLLAAGASNREISAALYITQNTAANHVRSILAKTGCANRTRAARFATEHGLV